VWYWHLDSTLARQALHHLSHTSSPFCCGYFGDVVSSCLGWPQISILWISASRAVRITGMSHEYLACTAILQGIIQFLIVESSEYIYFGYKCHIKQMNCRIFSHSERCLTILDTSALPILFHWLISVLVPILPSYYQCFEVLKLGTESSLFWRLL
jgi:hypothetical protein